VKQLPGENTVRPNSADGEDIPKIRFLRREAFGALRRLRVEVGLDPPDLGGEGIPRLL
jgi:hypothetical protein